MGRTPHSLITVDLAAIRKNVRSLKALLPPRSRLLAVVKADGYGHDPLETARAATEAGAAGAAVARAREAASLRDAGFTGSVLIMGPVYDRDECLEMAAMDVELTVMSDHMARLLLEINEVSRPARIHLKVDSGMNRQGLMPAEVPAFLESLRHAPGVRLVGVMTHFACAAEDLSTVDEQLRRFLPVARQVKAYWPDAMVHAANSAATLYCPHAHLDMVRCGIAVYGLSPTQQDAEADGLQPALRWTSQVVLVKRVPAGEGVGYGHTFRPSTDRDIALVPIGYGDGLLRSLGNHGHVLIQGRRYPMVGRVSMDSFAVDVGTDGRVRVGDTVTLIGRDGRQRITAEDMAGWAGTVNYEITCNISLDRAQRRFVDPECDIYPR